MKTILILGATSAIASEFARLCAAAGNRLILAARSEDKLQRLQQDLEVLGAASVSIHCVDFSKIEALEDWCKQLLEQEGAIDTALIAHGSLPDQQLMQQSFAAANDAFALNALSYMALMTVLANAMEQRGQGTIAVIGSVAGDRGRKSNYLYGTAKSAIATFAEGLRNRLESSGVQVLTVKPGFVDTPMTASFEKGALWATPKQVARAIRNGISTRRNVIYTPFFWRFIMLVIRHIPEFVFKKLSL